MLERGSVTIDPATDRVDYARCLIVSSLNIFGRVAPGVNHANGYGGLNAVNEDGSEQSSNYCQRQPYRPIKTFFFSRLFAPVADTI